ncbi:hypothetical protein pipiens_004197 [Culex pipiens pipiens]|uniref:Ferritin n=1 Tax=Culex pipiens pipiens TaxID=38569 RepID=A0ABD1CLM2_CULPP
MFVLRRLPLSTLPARRLFASGRVICPPEDPAQPDGSKSENLAAPQINALVQGAINEQINSELFASHTYLSMSYFFARSGVGLMGFSGLYRSMSQEEQSHADALAKYLLKRNGAVELNTIKKPATCSWANIGTTLNETVRLENCVSESLSTLYRLAEKHNDVVTTDFIVTEFLNEQIESIREVNLLIARWRTLEKTPNGVYLLNRELEHKFKA